MGELRRAHLRSSLIDAVQRLIAVLLLVAFVPLLLLVAALVRGTSRGPVVFRQTRTGEYGRPFQIYKFRTMRVGAERELLLGARTARHVIRPFMKLDDDPRVTPVGRMLRATSLDELPQLWNVVRGEMNLVGPRPLVTYENSLCPADTGQRLLVKPGLTGLWQVSGRSDVSTEQALMLDVRYVQRRSLALDLSILLRSTLVPFTRRGAR